MAVAASMHLLDWSEPDVRFIVQIKTDIGQSEGESNISLNLHNKLNVRLCSAQQMLFYAKSIGWSWEKVIFIAKITNVLKFMLSLYMW